MKAARRNSALLTAMVTLCVSSVSVAEAPAPNGWNVIEERRGITVSRKEQPDCGLPAFRGQGVIQGDVVQILALMLDSDAVEQWAYGVDDARRLKRLNANQDLIYLYSDIPWPVRDRDMIVRRTVTVVKPGEEFHIDLKCDPTAVPEKSGVVRVKTCSSGFHLRKISATTTEIDYDMSLDPAGLLPKWAASYVSKTVPYKTLVTLEERAGQSREKYEAVIQRWSTATF